MDLRNHTLRAASALALLGLLSGCAHTGRAGDAADDTRSPADTVTAADLDRSPSQPIEQVLAGRISGVTVTRTPDGGIAVRIRGQTSIEGDNEPLYVIDGVPIRAGPGGALTGINPYDIESIQVLKGPAETAMYGARGANGVILVRLKAPGR